MDRLTRSDSRGGHAADSLRRRMGFTAAIVVNGLLLWLVNGWPGWRAVPILTADAVSVIAMLNLALVLGIGVNIINALMDIRWVRAAGEIATSLATLLVLAQLLAVFPFSVSNNPVDWAFVLRVALWFAVVGCVISILVNAVIIVREATRQHRVARVE